MGEDTGQTDTSTDNKGRLELSGAREPTHEPCYVKTCVEIVHI